LQQGAVLENRVNHWCVLELLATASVSVFGISGGLFERQVRKMACHFTPPSEFRTPQKRQLRFALRKRPYAEVFGTFYRHRKYEKNNDLRTNTSQQFNCAIQESPCSNSVAAIISLYSTAFLNLLTVVVCSFCSLYILTFWRPKSYKKPRHRIRQSNEALFVSTRHHSVASFLPLLS
jgi:hypothetical protein